MVFEYSVVLLEIQQTSTNLAQCVDLIANTHPPPAEQCKQRRHFSRRTPDVTASQ